MGDDNPERREWSNKDYVILGIIGSVMANGFYEMTRDLVAQFLPDFGQYWAILLGIVASSGLFYYGYFVRGSGGWKLNAKLYSIVLWRAVIGISMIPLLIGLLLLLLGNPTYGFGFMAFAFGVVGVGLGFIVEGLIAELREGEVNQKIAVLSAMTGNNGLQIISELRTLKTLSRSIKPTQATYIQLTGKYLLEWLLAHSPANMEEAEGILSEILRPFKLEVLHPTTVNSKTTPTSS